MPDVDELLPIVIVGPTATGKTNVAVQLAHQVNGEIINADSMQVYRGMDIGTAKPSREQRAGVAFHLLDIVNPDEPFNVAEWKRRALIALSEIAVRGKRAILCGGTGLYIRALLDDWTLADTPANPEIRQRLQQEAAQQGSAVLHERLQTVDPTAAARLHPNDGVRIMRALEVWEASGRTLTDFLADNQAHRHPRPALRFGLTLPRPELYARIDRRVETMLEHGLKQEVQILLAQGYAPDLPPLKSLGYKEMISHLHGREDLMTAIRSIQQNTRRYAKRQQTWFHADTAIDWINVSALSSAEVAHLLRQRC